MLTQYSPGLFIFTLLASIVALFVISPSSASITFKSKSVISNLCPTFIVTRFLEVITGAWFSFAAGAFSTTFTPINFVTVLPCESITDTFTQYCPGLLVSTSLASITALSVISPSSLSITFKSKSFISNLSPTFKVMLSLEVTTGASSFTTGAFSTTFTPINFVTVLPCESITDNFTQYCPGLLVSTSLASITALSVISPSSLSITFKSNIFYFKFISYI